jgi:ADP-heptose:LPS heptosyltransferase
MAKPRNLLIFRFSSLGDVAMTVPVIQLLLKQHPDLHATIVSNNFVAPLFKNIDRLNFYAADLKGKHRGLKGLYKLYKELKNHSSFDAIADLHDVLRTKILRAFFSFSREPIAVIDKGRIEKKELTRKKNKILRRLKSTFQRYADVFESLELPVVLTVQDGIKEAPSVTDNYFEQLKSTGNYIIGLAPFAQYAEKTYPPEKMKEVVKMLLQHTNNRIFLFGGVNDKEVLEQWENEFEGLRSMAGKMNFEKELEVIAQLDVMISMDSANMHLASLFGVPVVSVWGATHPFAGFYGWGQAPENAVQIDLYCRPCSVFGNKPGYRGDLLCLHSIFPLTIYNKVMENLRQENIAFS